MRLHRCRCPGHARQVLVHSASPAEYLLRTDLPPPRYLGYPRSRNQRLRDDPCLLTRRPAPAPARPRQDLNPPISALRVIITSNIRIARSPLPQANQPLPGRRLKKGVRAPLTVHQPKATVERWSGCRKTIAPTQTPLQPVTLQRTPMPRGRQLAGDHALSDAERQARYRAGRQAEPASPRICYRRPIDAPDLSVGTTPSPNCSPCRPNTLPGATPCPKASATAQPLRLSRPSSNSILTSSPTSSRHVALDAIDW
jgi:hypothetical protein